MTYEDIEFVIRAGLGPRTLLNYAASMCHDDHFHGLTWRTIGQAILIYFAMPDHAVTSQDMQPGRATLAEMVAFARLASIPCARLAPDVESLRALALERLAKPPLAEKEIVAKETEVRRLRNRVGHKRWCQRYTGLMEQARILVQVLRRQN